MKYLFILAVGLFTSALLTWKVREYALKNALLDIPNERSSHKISTARGGGLSVVVTFFLLSLYLYIQGYINSENFISLLVSSLLVSIVGFWDDHHSLSRKLRITIHLFATIWLFYWVGGLGPLATFNFNIDLGVFGDIIGVVALVWLLNLYNFMDGIDGIAAVEAITVAGSAAFLLFLHSEVVYSFWLLILAVCCFGFLIWNWPPAKIFLGDVGSGFLGFTLGAFALITSNVTDLTVWTWLILIGVFFVDATVTLIRRMIRGDKWVDAHRSHAYQHAAIKYQSHKKVTVAVMMINLVWLMPWAYFSVAKPGLGLLFIILAYTPLIAVAIKFEAGKEVVHKA